MICIECGKEAYLDNWTPSYLKQLIERQCCADCDYWIDRIPFQESKIVIKGYCYYLETKPTKRDCDKGMYGRKFTIKKFSGEIIETDNLWCNGRIPDIFKKRIPDNADFLLNS